FLNNNSLTLNSNISIGGITGNIPANLDQSLNTSNATLVSTSDSLTTNTWTINQANGGTLSNGIGTLQFNNIKNLTGGAGSDIFNFLNNGKITGTINGSTGSNSLDFSGRISAVNFSMSTTNNTGIATDNSAVTLSNYQNIFTIN